MRRQKGTTLVELMVYVGVFTVFIGLVYGTLFFAMRYYKHAEKMLGYQHSAVLSMTKLTNALAESKRSTIRISSDSNRPGIMFASSKNGTDNQYSLSSSGQIQYQRWVCFYLEPQEDGTMNMIMKEHPITPTVNPIPPSHLSTVAGFASNQTVQRTVIGRNIVELQVLIQPQTLNNFVITIEAGDNDMSGGVSRKNRVQAHTEILVSNL